ncbi:MAG: chromosomal replication initiation protein, partial [Brachybacterium sp.]|nr:chromosomal replication initiation protein [Brachybacterium sp.]
MPDANVAAIWERTLATLRRDDTVSQRVIALLTLSRLMAVVADTALVAAPSTSAKELFEHRVAGSLKAALSEAVGHEMRFAVTVDESLLLEEDTDEPAVTSTSGTDSAHSVDKDVDSPVQDVHTAPFRRDEGSILPPAGQQGPAALPDDTSAASADASPT